MNESEIMELYNLNASDMKVLSSMIIEEIPTMVDRVDMGGMVLIQLDKLVGFDRIYNVHNWWEAIMSLHKINTLKWISKKEKLAEYMQNIEQLNMDGLPCVSEYKGKYYISDDGCHRLTVAKCVGIKKAYVYVKCLCSDQMV